MSTLWRLSLGLVVAVLIGEGGCSKMQRYSRVIGNILDMSEADRLTPPFPADDSPVVVNMTLFLTNIVCLDTGHNRLDVAGYLMLWWTDPRLARAFFPHRPDYSVKVDASAIWTPDIELFNAQAPGLEYLDKRMRVMIEHTGRVMLAPQVALHSICSPASKHAPVVTCRLRLGSYLHPVQEMDLVESWSGLVLASLLPSNDWELTASSWTRQEVIYRSCCPDTYSSIVFSLTLTRRN